MKMPECPHMFHRECVNRYCEVTGKALNKACPYKCTRGEDDPSDEGVAVVGTLLLLLYFAAIGVVSYLLMT